MEMFEYDIWKSMSNLEKHGIDFQEAQELWLDPGLVEFRLYHSGGKALGRNSTFAGWAVDSHFHYARWKNPSYFCSQVDDERGVVL